MSDFIIIDGDQAIFQSTVGIAQVIPLPGRIMAKGGASLNQKKVCVEGDEASVLVAGVVYFTPIYSIPGVGNLLIDRLGPDQVARHTRSNGKAALLKGSNFFSKLQVVTPAQQPPPGTAPPVPDPMPEYMGGQGTFVTANCKFKGT